MMEKDPYKQLVESTPMGEVIPFSGNLPGSTGEAVPLDFTDLLMMFPPTALGGVVEEGAAVGVKAGAKNLNKLLAGADRTALKNALNIEKSLATPQFAGEHKALDIIDKMIELEMKTPGLNILEGLAKNSAGAGESFTYKELQKMGPGIGSKILDKAQAVGINAAAHPVKTAAGVATGVLGFTGYQVLASWLGNDNLAKGVFLNAQKAVTLYEESPSEERKANAWDQIARAKLAAEYNKRLIEGNKVNPIFSLIGDVWVQGAQTIIDDTNQLGTRMQLRSDEVAKGINLPYNTAKAAKDAVEIQRLKDEQFVRDQGKTLPTPFDIEAQQLENVSNQAAAAKRQVDPANRSALQVVTPEAEKAANVIAPKKFEEQLEKTEEAANIEEPKGGGGGPAFTPAKTSLETYYTDKDGNLVGVESGAAAQSMTAEEYYKKYGRKV